MKNIFLLYLFYLIFLLLVLSSFLLIYANIYFIVLTICYHHIFKTHKLIQIITIFWLLSLILYGLTVFKTFEEFYRGIFRFWIHRSTFSWILIITMISGQDLPAVQIFQADYTIFNQGPFNKTPFLREYHVSILFSDFLSYGLATSVFVTNPIIYTFLES